MENIARSECGKAHGPNWLKWLGHLKDKPCTGMELGTWMGESAEWMLENICTHERSRYHCVDPFTGSDEHRLAGIDCTKLHEQTVDRIRRFAPKYQIHVQRSEEMLRTFGEKLDWVYVDADHHAMNVLRDSVLAFDLLKVGGVMIWDDYGWKVMENMLDRPLIAIDAFLHCYERQIEVLPPMGWQIAVRKIREG